LRPERIEQSREQRRYTDFDENSERQAKDWRAAWSPAAARLRALAAEATTPAIKEHLRRLIDEAERLQGETADASPLDY
jgi:hypothetical protein